MKRIKNYEELTFSDDFMFGKVMSDMKLCEKVLECLLQQPIADLQEIQAEREFKAMQDGKPIRLDIYTRDDKTVYDAEMQNRNKQGFETISLPKRSRAYQALVDTDFLKKAMKYDELPESVVVFICTFDPFGCGKYKYTFSEMSEDNSGMKLGSGTSKHFFNCAYDGDDAPEEVLRLYRYIRDGVVEDELTRTIDVAVAKVKKNEQWRSDYMKELFIYEDYKREGRAEGREEGKINQLVELVKDGLLKLSDAVARANMTEEEFKKLME